MKFAKFPLFPYICNINKTNPMRKLILSFLLILVIHNLSAFTPINNHPIILKKYDFNGLELNIVPFPRDTLPISAGNGIDYNQYKIICFKSFDSSQLSILSNFNEEDVEIIIFERIKGIVHTDNITLRAEDTTILDTPWGKGVYTIIFKLKNGYILLGDFIII